MKVEEREDGLNFIPENEFEVKALKRLRREVIARSKFEDDWKCEGKLIVDFDYDWGR
jgi:hypothetical protein